MNRENRTAPRRVSAVRRGRMFFCLLLCLGLLLGVCSGCGRNTAGYQTVMTIGSYDVPYVQYYYLYQNYKLDRAAQGLTGEELDRLAREDTLISLRYTGAVYSLAEQCGVSLTKAQKKQIRSNAESYRDQYGGRDAFEKALQENYNTYEFFCDALEFAALTESLRSYLSDAANQLIPSDDDTVKADVWAHFWHASHILLSVRADGGNEEKQLAKGQELLARLQAGEDYDTLLKENTEDTDLKDPTVGYYFTEGQFLQKFEDAVKQLEIGEITDALVRTEAGYHIIRRLPLDETYIEENLGELREMYLARSCNERIAAQSAALDLTYTDYYQTLTAEYLDSHRFG